MLSSVLAAVIVAAVIVVSSPEKSIFLGSVASKVILAVGAVSFCISVVTCLFVAIMGVILCRRAHEKNVVLRSHTIVLYEMLPLLIYPICFTALGIPVIIFDVAVIVLTKDCDSDFLFTIEEFASFFASIGALPLPCQSASTFVSCSA